MALPTVDPPAGDDVQPLGGSPQSSISRSASAIALNGVCPAGLSTTGHPAAIAGATLCTTRLSGKLNGLIAPTTPIGTRIVKPTLPTPLGMASSGTTSPAIVRASAAENWIVPTARSASTRAVLIGLAASSAMILAKSSRRSVRRRAAVSSTSARCHVGSGPPASAAFAERTARSTSSGPHTGTRPIS